MDQNHDFSALQSLLALKRQDLPQDTQVEDFLAEFHRRQRSQLLVKQTVWSRVAGWVKDRAAGFELAPSLSYGAVAAAIALTAFLGLSQQVQVTHVDGQSKLSFRMLSHDTAFAMVPGSLVTAATVSPKVSDSSTFTANHADSAATRYVLANNSQGANDATVAF